MARGTPLTGASDVESADTWLDVGPLRDPGTAARLMIFLQRAIGAERIDLEPRASDRYAFHLGAPPSRVLEAILRFAGSVPIEVQMPASGYLHVWFSRFESAGPAHVAASPRTRPGELRATAARGNEPDRRSPNVWSTAGDWPPLEDETGALAWYAFTIVATIAVSQAKQSGSPLALLIVALDQPAVVTQPGSNPRSAIQVTADSIQASQASEGSGGVMGRHGPHSLAVLAQNTGRDDAWRLGQRIRSEVLRRTSEIDTQVRFTVTVGISTLPHAGASFADLVHAAEEAVSEAGAQSGDQTRMSRASAVVSGPDGEPMQYPGTAPAPVLAPAALAEKRREVLEQAIQQYEQDAIEGIAIQTAAEPCRTCAEAARSVYVPRWAPPLPLAGCTAPAGCRCLYNARPVDPRQRPPPVPATALDKIEIPRSLRDAALFGTDPKGSAKAEAVAQYVDEYPLLPFEAGLELQSGEATYLTRPVRYGWEEAGTAVRTRGVAVPLAEDLPAWVRQLARLPRLPGEALPRKEEGVVYLTNWRTLFGKRPTLGQILHTNVTAIELFRDAIALTVRDDDRRLLLLLRDPLQVALYFSRALRDIGALV